MVRPLNCPQDDCEGLRQDISYDAEVKFTLLYKIVCGSDDGEKLTAEDDRNLLGDPSVAGASTALAGGGGDKGVGRRWSRRPRRLLLLLHHRPRLQPARGVG